MRNELTFTIKCSLKKKQLISIDINTLEKRADEQSRITYR